MYGQGQTGTEERKMKFGDIFLTLEEIDEERVADDIGRYVVTQQALRMLSFHMGTDTFTASNGWHIFSVCHPELDIGLKRMGVWGSDQSDDKKEIAIPDDNIDDIVVAVTEYNKHMHSLLDPTDERLRQALDVVTGQNRNIARSDAYRITKIREVMKTAPADTQVITELIKELVKSVLDLPLDEEDLMDKTPDLTAWVDPGNFNVRHIVSYGDDVYSTVFKGEGQSGKSSTTRLMTSIELKALFGVQPIPFLAACCLSKRFQNGFNNSDAANVEENESESEEKRRRTGGRDFWRV